MNIGDTIANNRHALIEARHILRMGVCVVESFHHLGVLGPFQVVDDGVLIANHGSQ